MQKRSKMGLLIEEDWLDSLYVVLIGKIFRMAKKVIRINNYSLK
jgi:hypothetical protein